MGLGETVYRVGIIRPDYAAVRDGCGIRIASDNHVRDAITPTRREIVFVVCQREQAILHRN